MDKFKLETSLQFPFFKLNEIVTYSEVKKPSGIAYILLVLISESKTKTDKLVNVLENFGVPKTLHYIFADTIEYLFNSDILENDFKFNKNKFDIYKINDFKFTVQGRKIFAEESIPTGINKESKISVFYDIARNELFLKLDTDLEAKPLMESAITLEFMSKFSCNKDVENFLNLQKGKGIGIKKEEIITKVEQINGSENWIGKYDCTMNITSNTVAIKFDNLVLQKFFDENYTADMVNKALSYKNNFIKHLRLNEYYSKKIENILIPREFDEVLKQKCQLAVSKGNYKGSSKFIISNSDLLEKFDDKIDLVQIDMHDLIFAYVPGMFEFDHELLGVIVIPLVLKIRLSWEELKSLVQPYIESIREYTEDNFIKLVQLTSITKDVKKAYGVMDNYLSDNAGNNIVKLNEMKQTALLNTNILAKYKELLTSNYFKYLDSINEDNLESVLKITNLIPKFLNISPKEILDKIFNNISPKNNIFVYELLVEKGFDKSLVLMYVNPVLEALQLKNVNEKTLLDLISYNDFVEEMKKTSKIDNYKKYAINEDDINNHKFKTAFNNAFSLQKSIQIFRNKNEGIFANYDGLMKIYGDINDDINKLEDALKHPNNIKFEFIEKKIVSGDFQFVFVNLAAKLETILKNKFNLDGKLSDMLSEARKNEIIDKKIINDLHEFRENRNANIHPEDRTANFNANDLRRWSKEIFDLEVSSK